MNYRMVQILASEAATIAATKVIDLDLANPISRLLIRMKGVNNGSTPTAHPAKMVQKIEIVDGSDVIYSCSGIEAQAVNFQENGELPFNICEYEDNIECCATYQINFGRRLWDEVLALDPMKFKNLQLKITHNKALGGSCPDAGTLAVFAYVFDDKKITPRGFLMTKELYSYALTASAHEYIDLPLDYAFRFVMLQSYTSGKNWNDQFGYLKFTIDTDRRVLLNDISGSEFLKCQIPMDLVEEDFAGLGTDSAVEYFVAQTYEGYGVAIGRSHSQTTLIVGQPAGPLVEVTNDASESFACHHNGYAAFGAMNLIVCDKDDETSWLSPAGYQSIKLDITAGGGASGTAYVVTQQFRTY